MKLEDPPFGMIAFVGEIENVSDTPETDAMVSGIVPLLEITSVSVRFIPLRTVPNATVSADAKNGSTPRPENSKVSIFGTPLCEKTSDAVLSPPGRCGENAMVNSFFAPGLRITDAGVTVNSGFDEMTEVTASELLPLFDMVTVSFLVESILTSPRSTLLREAV